MPTRRLFPALAMIAATACEGNQRDIVAPDLAIRNGISAEKGSAKQTRAKGPLVLIAQPTEAYTSVPFDIQPTLEVRDKRGLLDVGFNGLVTASLVGFLPGALGGTTSVQAVNGVATFTDLQVEIASSSLTIEFTTPGGTPAQFSIPSYIDKTILLYPVADASVNDVQPTVNNGTSATALVNSESFGISTIVSYTYLKFDLSSIPAGSDILEASFTMVAYDGYAWGGDGSVYAHHVTDDSWAETGITWNTKPAYNLESVGSWWLFYDGITVSEQTGSFNTLALANLIETEQGNLMSLMLRSPGYDTYYFTREYEIANRRPVLSVRYKPAI